MLHLSLFWDIVAPSVVLGGPFHVHSSPLVSIGMLRVWCVRGSKLINLVNSICCTTPSIRAVSILCLGVKLQTRSIVYKVV